MEKGQKNAIPIWLAVLALLILLPCLAAVLYHITYCLDDHANCHICLLAATLVILAVFSLIFRADFLFYIQKKGKNFVLFLRILAAVIRAPPAIFSFISLL